MELSRLLVYLSSQDLCHIADPGAPVTLLAGPQRWIEPGPLVALTTALLWRSQHTHAPIAADFSRAEHPSFFSRMGFFTLLGLRSPQPSGGERDPRDRFIPLTPFQTTRDVYDLARHGEALLDALGLPVAPYIRRSLEEAMRNSVQHAGSHDAVRLVCGIRFPQQGRVQLAVADSGIGITASLRRNPALQPASDRDALSLAVQPGVSGAATLPVLDEAERNYGFGLFLLAEIARRTGGYLFLASGDHALIQDGRQRSLHRIHPWRGTLLALELYESTLEDFDTLQRESRHQLPREPRRPRRWMGPRRQRG